MPDMSFDEAYETVCSKCGNKAGVHRLTRTGNLYCLSFNADNLWLERDKNVNIYRIPVSNLVRSPLGKSVGAVLDYTLHSLDNAQRT